jgi:hypothetical protein
LCFKNSTKKNLNPQSKCRRHKLINFKKTKTRKFQKFESNFVTFFLWSKSFQIIQDWTWTKSYISDFYAILKMWQGWSNELGRCPRQTFPHSKYSIDVDAEVHVVVDVDVLVDFDVDVRKNFVSGCLNWFSSKYKYLRFTKSMNKFESGTISWLVAKNNTYKTTPNKQDSLNTFGSSFVNFFLDNS